MKSYEIRSATVDDLKRYYGGAPPVTMRAQVIEIDGAIEGIWGLQFANGETICFSHLSAKAREDKRAVVEGVRAARKLLNEHEYVVAYADAKESTAPAFMRYIGFVKVGASMMGDAYVYKRH